MNSFISPLEETGVFSQSFAVQAKPLWLCQCICMGEVALLRGGFFVCFFFFPGGDPPTVPLKTADKMRERLSLACKNTT